MQYLGVCSICSVQFDPFYVEAYKYWKQIVKVSNRAGQNGVIYGVILFKEPVSVRLFYSLFL